MHENVGPVRNLRNSLSRKMLLSIFKSFIRCLLDFKNIDDQLSNTPFSAKKVLQYSIALVIDRRYYEYIQKRTLPQIRLEFPQTMVLIEETFLPIQNFKKWISMFLNSSETGKLEIKMTFIILDFAIIFQQFFFRISNI